MGGVFTAIVLILQGCRQNEVHSFFVDDSTTVVQVEISSSWMGQKACVSMYHARWYTEDVQCVFANSHTYPEEGTEIDFYVPVQTGVGKATIHMRYMRWGDGNKLSIPLGDRAKEFDLFFPTTNGQVSPERLSSAVLASRGSVEQEEDMWKTGTFSLMDQENRIHGAIVFEYSESARIFLFDSYWYTPDIVYTDIETLGAEMLLSFPIEPSFSDEQTYVRIQPFLRTLVIPSGYFPDDADIRYTLSPNPPNFEMLQQMAQEAITQSVEEEVKWVERQSQEILRNLQQPERCAQWKEESLTKPEKLLWLGYTIESRWLETECVLHVEPVLLQHRRRFMGDVRFFQSKQ